MAAAAIAAGRKPFLPLLFLLLVCLCSLFSVGQAFLLPFSSSNTRATIAAASAVARRPTQQTIAAASFSPVCSTVVKPETPKVVPQTGMQPVILVVEETEGDPQLEGGWQLILYNDEVNSRHHVARTLTMVCQLTDDQAYDVMMTAHRYGSAVVGEYTKGVAEGYCEGLLAAGIGCAVEKADAKE